MGFCKFNEIAAGTSGTPSPTCHCEEYPKGTCFAARSDAAIRSFPARRRIPTPVTRSLARNDRKRDVEDAVPYGVQQSYGDGGTPSPTTAHRTHPQGAMPTHRPAEQMRILRRDTWVPPYRVRRSCRTGRRDAVPYNGSPYPSAGGDAHTSPRRQHKEAGASACQLVEKVRMAFFGKLAGKIAK